ncbi:MAG: hypothetical protein RL557_68 [archaeon]
MSMKLMFIPSLNRKIINQSSKPIQKRNNNHPYNFIILMFEFALRNINKHVNPEYKKQNKRSDHNKPKQK